MVKCVILGLKQQENHRSLLSFPFPLTGWPIESPLSPFLPGMPGRPCRKTKNESHKKALCTVCTAKNEVLTSSRSKLFCHVLECFV